MRNRFTNLGWLVTILIGVTPIALWLFTQTTDWSTAKLVAENLGKLAGLAGLALFAWSVILSARLKIFDKLFLGLDNTYRAHHIISIVALILLLCHPMLLTLRYLLSSPIVAYEFLKPSFESPFRVLGQLTLYAFIALMLATLYLKIQHKTLILLMRMLGSLVFLGAIHAIFVGGSDINSLLLLQVYIIGLIAVAALVYVYRSIFHGNFSKRYPYVLENITRKGDVIELHLKPQKDSFTYLPGQFAFIKFALPGVLGESHPFTISNAADPKMLRFSVKQLGDYTNALNDIKVGTEVAVDGPYGTFSNQVVINQRQIWIAGGIGITPFLAMASDIQDKSQKIDLYYSLQKKGDDVYLDELQKNAKKYTNIRVIPFYTDQSGYLTADVIQQHSGQFEPSTAFLICGPPSMMKALRSQLVDFGVPKKSIHTEEFSLS